jgi:hypothetical protein
MAARSRRNPFTPLIMNRGSGDPTSGPLFFPRSSQFGVWFLFLAIPSGRVTFRLVFHFSSRGLVLGPEPSEQIGVG